MKNRKRVLNGAITAAGIAVLIMTTALASCENPVIKKWYENQKTASGDRIGDSSDKPWGGGWGNGGSGGDGSGGNSSNGNGSGNISGGGSGSGNGGNGPGGSGSGNVSGGGSGSGPGGNSSGGNGSGGSGSGPGGNSSNGNGSGNVSGGGSGSGNGGNGSGGSGSGPGSGSGGNSSNGNGSGNVSGGGSGSGSGGNGSGGSGSGPGGNSSNGNGSGNVSGGGSGSGSGGNGSGGSAGSGSGGSGGGGSGSGGSGSGPGGNSPGSGGAVIMLASEGSLQLGILDQFSNRYDLLGMRAFDRTLNPLTVEYSYRDAKSGTWKLNPSSGTKQEAWVDAWVLVRESGETIFLPVTQTGGLFQNLVTAIPIGKADELAEIGKGKDGYPLDWFYFQYASLDLSGYSRWEPIGTAISSAPFTGIYDGRGKAIQRLKIDRTKSVSGLFGGLGKNAIVRDVHILNGDVRGGSSTGGIAGQSYGSILDCTYSGSVTGGNNTGGIAGEVQAASIIADSSFIGSVSGTGTYTGGIAGLFDNSTMTNCINDGLITGKISVGGIAGGAKTKGGSYTNCNNAGEVRGTKNVGGITGSNNGASILSCSNTKPITGEDYAGGITGETYNNGIITASYNTANITADEYPGGITGRAANSEIYACRNSGNIRTVASYPGGIAGLNSSSSIISCYNTGTITANLYAAGIIGCNTGHSEISACYSNGKLASVDPGGIIGENTRGKEELINACYFVQESVSIAGMAIPNTNNNAKPFGDSSYVPYDIWPRVETNLSWGMGDGSGKGKYWKYLGSWKNGKDTVFPVLYWE
ncbi:MAG: hypothetical protein LBD48_11095 [Treponema sp.]|nr:hypothetical protein [Treponema sp.]